MCEHIDKKLTFRSSQVCEFSLFRCKYFLVLWLTKAFVDFFFEFVFLCFSLKMETSSVSKRLLFQMVIHKCAIQMFLLSWSMFTIGRYTWVQINSNVFNLSHCLPNSAVLFPLVSLCF